MGSRISEVSNGRERHVREEAPLKDRSELPSRSIVGMNVPFRNLTVRRCLTASGQLSSLFVTMEGA